MRFSLSLFILVFLPFSVTDHVQSQTGRDVPWQRRCASRRWEERTLPSCFFTLGCRGWVACSVGFGGKPGWSLSCTGISSLELHLLCAPSSGKMGWSTWEEELCLGYGQRLVLVLPRVARPSCSWGFGVESIDVGGVRGRLPPTHTRARARICSFSWTWRQQVVPEL